jgi:Sulfotransferase family
MKIVQNNKPLAVIVCGFEGGGTTMLSEILKQHPRLESGFEGGFLLVDKPQEFLSLEPYCTDLKKLWEVSEEDLKYICQGEIWPDVYRRLHDRAKIIKKNDTWLVDKTPRYMAFLPSVLQKVPNVPCIVLTRDPRSVLWTRTKRTYNKNAPKGLTRTEWAERELEPACQAYLAYARGLRQAMEKGFGDKILLVKYESLCINQETEVMRIFDFIGMQFDLSYLSIKDKDPRYHPCRGNEISVQYLTEYKDNLSEETAEKALKMTEEFKSFWYLPS